MLKQLSKLKGRLAEVFEGFRRDTRPSSPHRPRNVILCVEQLDERILPSISPVNPTMGSALMGIVDLKVTFPDGKSAAGTGTMIDSSHVLTAAHLIYSAQDGGYAKSIEAIPAAHGNYDPLGVAFATYERVDPSWLSFNPSHPGMTSPSVEDIGLVSIESGHRQFPRLVRTWLQWQQCLFRR